MIWYVQDGNITFEALDRNALPLVKVLDELGLPRVSVGYDADSKVITGLEGADPSQPAFFYGSTTVAEIAAHCGLRPGAFYELNWFDPAEWLDKRGDLLNPQQRPISVGEFRQEWIDQPVFVKSVSPKVLTGMVLEGREATWWLEEYATLDEREILVLSPVQDIIQEWRFFIVDGAVVAGSQYRHDGVTRIREPICPAVWDQARRMAADDWIPSPNCVMDICVTRDEKFKIVEFNSINSSGFYAADIRRFVEAVEALTGKYV